MRFTAAVVFLFGSVAMARAQPTDSAPWQAGLVMGSATDEPHAGPVVSRRLFTVRHFSARAEASAQLRVATPFTHACGGSQCFSRVDAWYGIVGLTLELGPRSADGRGWYALWTTAAAAAEPEDGTRGYSLPPAVGVRAVTYEHVIGYGVGREFAALGGRNRVELRVERLRNRGGRLSFTRVW